jgi:hypothetical protein
VVLAGLFWLQSMSTRPSRFALVITAVNVFGVTAANRWASALAYSAAGGTGRDAATGLVKRFAEPNDDAHATVSRQRRELPRATLAAAGEVKA